jgi:hypothetical protein
LPGGALLLSTGKTTGRVNGYINDNKQMGRWTGTIYNTGKNNKLLVISAYRPCNTKVIGTFSTSTYAQQLAIAATQGEKNPDPRKLFVDHLIAQYKPICSNNNNYVIMMMDANECMSDSNSGIKRMINECNLVDAYNMIHSEDYSFPTHERGSKRIDYLLCTPNLLPFISRIGYVKFNEGLDGDHRAIFCDISEAIFDDEITEIATRHRRVGTNSTNKEGTKYVRYLTKKLKENNVFEEVNNLLQQCDSKEGINEEIEKQIEQKTNEMDDIITKLMLQAEEKTCKKKYIALWTPTLEQSHLIIQYWCVRLKSEKLKINGSKRINNILKRMTDKSKQLVQDNTLSLTRALRKAIKDHKELLRNNFQLRKEYLQFLVQEFNERGTSAQALTVQALITREQTRHDFQCIRRCLKETSHSKLTSIEIPCEVNQGQWKTIHEPQMTPKLTTRSISHFGQADKTPFASDPLKTILGYEGTNIASKELIEQQIFPDDIIIQDEYTQAIINKLKDGGNLTINQYEITFEEFKQAFINWNEKTTTSPSGRHLGHYKLLTILPVFDKNNNNLSEQLLQLYYNITKIMTKLGKSLNRWKNISTMMIEKDKGSPKITRLREILLYEADYNLILKVVWARKTVWAAHNKQVLHPGQAGSRPGKRAIDVVIQKEIKYLYARTTKTLLGTIDNDAASCYDRIICNLAMLISKYYGVPDRYCELQANNLHYSKYTTRTALGDSSNYYQHTESTPIHGTGQGSCASPAIWLLISSFIMTLLQKMASGMTIEGISPEDKEIIQWIEGFVDNTSIFTNTDFEETDIKVLREKLKNDGTIWSGLLKATGGKLELKKCFYYLLGWKWNINGTAIPMTIRETDPDDEGIN